MTDRVSSVLPNSEFGTGMAASNVPREWLSKAKTNTFDKRSARASMAAISAWGHEQTRERDNDG